MRFAFTPEQEGFREEVKEFIRTELPDGYEDAVGGTDEWWENETTTRKKLADKGWLTMAWPKEYGGQDAPIMQQVVFNDEWAYAHAPGWDGEGIGYIGPAIMVHGTEDQKKKHIGGIARGEVVWCQGYSEPEAGSDLASLQTRAEDKGDHYVINGQKIWTSQAHYADWILLLARTDPDAPKHRGISMFLADMKDPSIDVRPIINMTDSHEFNETFFDNLKVPKENVVGEVNRGWYAGMTLLDFERSGVEYAAYSRRVLDDTVQYARETKSNGEALIELPAVRNKLSEIARGRRGLLYAFVPDSVSAGQRRGAQQRGIDGQAVRQRGAAAGIQDLHGYPRPVRSAARRFSPPQRGSAEPVHERRVLHHRRGHVGDTAGNHRRPGARAAEGHLGRV